MPDLYLIVIVLLFFLAIADLVVGVSNDAVNFLNSAIGSKVTSRRTIMIIASMGLFLGAMFSSGMMEVARKGIFNPDFFYFSEVMAIFLAVMLTDIFLLDLFNTFGLPTSTTVSLVFELLGASVAVSIIKIAAAGQEIGELGNYINSSSALTIISGIFISVGVAFVVGSFIQYLSRLLFSFHYEQRMKYIGSIWSGLALSFLSYFLLVKGIKGASFVPDNFIKWIGDHTLGVMISFLVSWTLVTQLLVTFFKVNILKIVVLFGTFSLAMAFAGNDLVNFIGVPMAGFESFKVWTTSGQGADELMMSSLSKAVRTDPIFLVLAGIIMILTLWFSRKAQSVTETEVNLGRQDEGSERFQPNLLARGLVRLSRNIGYGLSKIIPVSWQKAAEKNFAPRFEQPINGQEHDPPAFDLIRASVNLTVASMLIAFATSLKLPLSTTYVSFMVAMGSSLSDRAWGRNSAVYRIAGVLSVIGGWFFTAFVAFTVSAIFAFLINQYGGLAIGLLVFSITAIIFRTYLMHSRQEKIKANMKAFEKETSLIPVKSVIDDTAKKVGTTLKVLQKTYKNALSGLLHEDRNMIKLAKVDMKELKEKNLELRYKLFRSIKRIVEKNAEGSRSYLLVYDLEQDILQSAAFIVKSCEEHVENNLEPLDPGQQEKLEKTMQLIDHYLEDVIQMIRSFAFETYPALRKEKKQLLLFLENLLSEQAQGIQASVFGQRNSLLFFDLILETKDIVAVAARFVKLYYRTQKVVAEKEVPFMSGEEGTV